jgi:hypothetical protein
MIAGGAFDSRGLGALVAVRDDVDLDPDRDGLELALVAAVLVLRSRIRCRSWPVLFCWSRGTDPLRWRDRQERNDDEPGWGAAKRST